jgi:hypothetical protein
VNAEPLDITPRLDARRAVAGVRDALLAAGWSAGDVDALEKLLGEIAAEGDTPEIIRAESTHALVRLTPKPGRTIDVFGAGEHYVAPRTEIEELSIARFVDPAGRAHLITADPAEFDPVFAPTDDGGHRLRDVRQKPRPAPTQPVSPVVDVGEILASGVRRMDRIWLVAGELASEVEIAIAMLQAGAGAERVVDDLTRALATYEVQRGKIVAEAMRALAAAMPKDAP